MEKTAGAMTDNPCRNLAYHLMHTLAKKHRELVDIPILKPRGLKEVKSGGFGIVHRAQLGDRVVAVKEMKRYQDDDPGKADRVRLQLFRGAESMNIFIQALRREILLWSIVSAHHHPGILPLLGTTDRSMRKAMMVAPWMKNGDLRSYISQDANANVNRLHIVRAPVVISRIAAHYDCRPPASARRSTSYTSTSQRSYMAI